MEFILKAILSGLIVATVSAIAVRNATVAAVVMGIPITALLSMLVWMLQHLQSLVLKLYTLS